MGILDSIKGALKGHSDEAEKALDKAGDLVDDRTDHQHSSQIDTAVDKVGDVLDKLDESNEPTPKDSTDE